MVACTLGDVVHLVAESLLKSGANPNGDPYVSLSVQVALLASATQGVAPLASLSPATWT